MNEGVREDRAEWFGDGVVPREERDVLEEEGESVRGGNM